MKLLRRLMSLLLRFRLSNVIKKIAMFPLRNGKASIHFALVNVIDHFYVQQMSYIILKRNQKQFSYCRTLTSTTSIEWWLHVAGKLSETYQKVQSSAKYYNSIIIINLMLWTHQLFFVGNCRFRRIHKNIWFLWRRRVIKRKLRGNRI